MASTKAADLMDELEERRHLVNLKGRRIERYIDICWWGSIIFAGLASVAGFVAAAPEVREHFIVEPWMISMLAAIAAGFQLVRQKASWRAKSNE